jgi:hypothetical protein
MTTAQHLGRITVPLLQQNGETVDFTSDEPEPGSINTLPGGYAKCPICSGSLVGTTRRLYPPEGAFCPPLDMLYDECPAENCDYRRPL